MGAYEPPDRVAIIEAWRGSRAMWPKVVRYYVLGWLWCKLHRDLPPIPSSDGWIEVVW